MKKFIATICLYIFCVTLNAQHLSFMGIQLGQQESTFDRMLKGKGFRYVGINNARFTRMYKGEFWRFGEVTINTESEENKVTSVFILSPYGAYLKMPDFNLLVHSLDEKYGKHHPISSFFKYSEFSDDTGFYWKTPGGYIVTYYLRYPTNYEQIMISIYYLDNTNHRIVQERGNKRNKDNDL